MDQLNLKDKVVLITGGSEVSAGRWLSDLQGTVLMLQ